MDPKLKALRDIHDLIDDFPMTNDQDVEELLGKVMRITERYQEEWENDDE